MAWSVTLALSNPKFYLLPTAGHVERIPHSADGKSIYPPAPKDTSKLLKINGQRMRTEVPKSITSKTS